MDAGWNESRDAIGVRMEGGDGDGDRLGAGGEKGWNENMERMRLE